MHLLTETAIRATKPRQKPYKLRDGKGLHLLVTPAGGRLWRLRYRAVGRESMLSLGSFPEISLKRAREKRDDARRLLAEGINPAAHRAAEKFAGAQTFEAVAREWLAIHRKEVTEGTHEHTKKRLEKFVFPKLGHKPVAKVGAQDLLTALRPLEHRSVLETAKRTRTDCSRVLRHAVATGRAQYDAASALIGALASPTLTHYAAVTEPTKVGALLRAIDGYSGQPTTHAALRLAPLLFTRPGELRAAEWTEFNLEAELPEWRIPAERMKMREEHLVPLARQAVDILLEIQALTGRGRYCFPSLRTLTRPLSNNSLTAALRRLGYSGDEMTAHGFRSMASTLLNEQGFAPDVIELQLAHAERNKVRAAYNRAQRLDERRKMMQAWADYLDGLKASGRVVPIGRKTRA